MEAVPAEVRPHIVPREEWIAAPTDPEDERVEVGVAIVGGGPGGLACALRLTQLLEEEPAVRDELGDVPVALVEKGRSAGSHLLSGAIMRPSALEALLPDVPRGEWPTYGEVHADARLPPHAAARRALPADAAALPQRGQPRGLGRSARALAGRARRGGGRLRAARDGAAKLLVEDGEVRGVRTGDKGRGRDGRGARELRARLGPHGPGDRARRGRAGPPERRRARPLRARQRRPASSGSWA